MKWLLAVAFGLLFATLIVFVGVLLWAAAGFLFPERPWVLAAAAIGLVALAGAWTRYHREKRSEDKVPHRGMLTQSIPVAGPMGLVFTLGYMVMFCGRRVVHGEESMLHLGGRDRRS